MTTVDRETGLIEELAALVECESPSTDTAATAACAKVLDDLVADRLDARAEWHEIDGRPHLRWSFGRPRVLLLGHLDTVWPRGTTARWPFSVDGDRATGPGVFDMKAGLVQLFAALTALDDLDGVSVLVTSDEEVGSTTSQRLVEATAADVRAVLVLEPSHNGALKTARKGIALYRLDITGRAAHAGLEPERGVNATLEAAQQVLAAAALARPEIGTTVTPTLISGGSAVNTVPAQAQVAVDVRASTVDEMDRVALGLTTTTPCVDGATVRATVQSMRPPFEPSASGDLFSLADRLAQDLGLGPLGGAAVGGGSDGNLTAALGIPTLDGLGAVGGGAHAEGEWASVSAMVERAALLESLVRQLIAGSPDDE